MRSAARTSRAGKQGLMPAMPAMDAFRTRLTCSSHPASRAARSRQYPAAQSKSTVNHTGPLCAVASGHSKQKMAHDLTPASFAPAQPLRSLALSGAVVFLTVLAAIFLSGVILQIGVT